MPLLPPALLSSFVLVFVLSSEMYSVPSLIVGAMSMPSPPFRVSFLDHNCSPVEALSATALSAVSP